VGICPEPFPRIDCREVPAVSEAVAFWEQGEDLEPVAGRAQLVATPLAAALENIASIAGLHPLAEPVYFQAVAIIGLVGAFHMFMVFLIK
jgi:hypothetical protein